MTRLEDAVRDLLDAADPLPIEMISVGDAPGRVAAEDVLAPHPVPHFRRPAMDGYVCHDADIREASPEHPVHLRITRAVQMGELPGTGPARGEAWSITTGGPMPLQGDRVLPVEAVRRIGDQLRVERPPEGKTNIAEPGEDIRRDALLVAAGEVIHPPAAGALAACGIVRIKVRRRARVALVATGSELVEPSEGASLPPGCVFNSNSAALAGQLRALGCGVDYQGIVSDRPEDLREAFAALRQGYDVVVSTGGVSVGRSDAVHRTWLDLGVRRIVGRVDLKPGGPFFAGRLGGTWVVGLSGTPVACLAAFHLLLQPLLRRLEGRRHVVRPLRLGRLTTAFPRPSAMMRALWARIAEGGPGLSPAGLAGLPPASHAGLPRVEILTGRPEGTIASLLAANALVLVPPGTPPLAPASRVSVMMLDHDEDRDRLTVERPTPGPLVIGVIGESGSGKTTVIAGLIPYLTAEHLRVAVVKHAAHGFHLDHQESDSARMVGAGAAAVVLAGPDETAFRIATSIGDAGQIAQLVADIGERIWGASPDVILVEGFHHPGRPVIHVGRQKPGARAAEVWATIPAVPGLHPEALKDELRRLADTIRNRLPAARPARPEPTRAP